MIVVPDDFPSVFEGSEGHERAKRLGPVRVFTERGADQEAELIRRIGDATSAINIRAHARFSEGVFQACPKLKMVSVWGTGTDNIDLEAAGRRGVTVCNTPGVNAFAVAGRAFRAGLEAMRLELLPDASLLSNTVSCFKAPAGVEPAAVVSHMRDRYGILIGTGLDKIRTTTLRVGHMGITASPLYVLPTLSAIEMTLRELGYRSEAGAGVAAAQTIFADSVA